VASADDNGVDDFALFDCAIRRGFLDVSFDNVADAGITLISTENTDSGSALGAVLSATSRIERICNIEGDA